MLNVTPLSDRIIVQKQEIQEKTTAGGLVIPTAVQEKPQEGVVLAVGPGYYNDYHDKFIPLTVEVGDTVYFSKYGGAEIQIEDEPYLVMTERDLLAKKTKGE